MSNAYKTQILADGAIWYLRMDAPSGTTETDRTGGGNDGTYSGGFTLAQPGALSDGDSAAGFNGSTGQVSIPHFSALDVGTGDFSVECWVNASSAVSIACLVTRPQGAIRTWELYWDSLNGLFYLDMLGVNYTVSVSVSLNAWHHVVFTRSGTAGIFWVDGVAYPLGTLALVSATDTSGINIAKSTFGNPFAGLIDEVAFYNYKLSAAQVANHLALASFRSPSASISPSTSLSPSHSFSPSSSISPSTSMSPSLSTSASSSPSRSPSTSLSPSVSASASTSASVSPSSSRSPSVSVSASASPSLSPSTSVSPSASVSPSISPSASRSPSVSASASSSPSVSPSSSRSPSGSLSFSSSISPSISPSIGIDFTSAFVFVSVGGVLYAQSPDWPYGRPAVGTIDTGSLVITDIVDETPNTALFTMRGFKPSVGMEVIATLGWKDNPNRLFAGTVLSVQEVYTDTPAAKRWNVSCIDYTWQLNRHKVIKQYTTLSATAIAVDLIASFATSDFTTGHVAAGLEVLDAITFTNQDLPGALTALAKRIGGHWYVDYFKDIHLFITETTDAPLELNSAHPSLTDYAVTRDVSPIITRVLSEGGGVAASADAAPGDTLLRVDSDVWYNAAGGMVTSGSQRVTYAAAGQGYTPDFSIWTPQTSPVTLSFNAVVWVPALNLFVAVGPGSGTGSIMTSPNGVTWTSVTAPAIQYTDIAYSSSLGLLVAVGTGPAGAATSPDGVIWTSRTVPSSSWSGIVWAPALSLFVAVAFTGTNRVMTSPDGIAWTGRTASAANAWLKVAWSPALGLLAAVCDDTVSNCVMTSPDGTTWTTRTTTIEHAAGIAWSPTLGLFVTVGIDSFGCGSSPDGIVWTARTAAGPNNQFDHVRWIPELGLFIAPAFAPVGGATHGLTLMTSVDGINWVSYAKTESAAHDVAWSPTLGLLVLVGGYNAGQPVVLTNQSIIYAVLTGIPPSGAGSILYAIAQGDNVNLLVQVDDLAAQAAAKALLDPLNLVPDWHGEIEDYLQDGRVSYAEAIARGEAQLALLDSAQISIAYKSRDPLTRSGKSIYISIADVEGYFLIQQVSIADFSANSSLYPTFTVQLAATRFTFEDLLRVARLAA